MATTADTRKRSFKLPRLSGLDLQRLVHACQLLDFAHASLMQLNTQGKSAIGHLLFEAQQEILKVLAKGQGAIERHGQAEQPEPAGEDTDDGPTGAV